MLKQTRCEGLSIGRMAVARPWLFSQFSEAFEPPEDIFYTSAARLTRLLEIHYEPAYALKLFKKISPYFCASFKFGHTFNKQLIRAETLDDVRKTLDLIFHPPPQTMERPNLHLFL